MIILIVFSEHTEIFQKLFAEFVLTNNNTMNAVSVSWPRYVSLEMSVIDISNDSCSFRLFNCYLIVIVHLALIAM